MKPKFIGIDPDTPGNKCPACFIDAASGGLIFQGWITASDAVPVALLRNGPLSDDEAVVRLPARMRHIVEDAARWPRDPAPAQATTADVTVDAATGDMLFRGQLITDADALAETSQHSPIADDESLVCLPAGLADVILEAVRARADVR